MEHLHTAIFEEALLGYEMRGNNFLLTTSAKMEDPEI
jgi:hypothetical protein